MSVIKHRKTQLSKMLRTQIILIMDYILNEIYPVVKNKTFRLLNDPNARLVFLLALAALALVVGSGNDNGGS